jgi:hypothetical protein
MKSYWPHVDAPRHLQLIPAEVVANLLRPLGFEVVDETTSDAGGLSWNRFGWQRLLGNALPRWRILRLATAVAGHAIGLALSPIERRPMKGAAYTLILRKSPIEDESLEYSQTGTIQPMPLRSVDTTNA